METEPDRTKRAPGMLSLLLTRRFAPLVGCQFVAVFSNNYFLNALVFLVLFRLGGDAALVPLATAVLIAPTFFLAALGGQLADRFDMALVARRLRLADVAVSVIAAAGFLLGSLPVLFAALVLFGVNVALFGPIRYGIIPHLLAPEELPAGNASSEGSTFIAILLGTIAGGLVVRYGDAATMSALVVALSAASWSLSRFIPPTGESAPGLAIRPNVAAATWDVLRRLREDRRIAWGALALCWFWAAGTVAMALLPTLVKNVLGGDEIAVTVCLALFTVGIAGGSALAARLAAGRIALRPTIVATTLIGVFAVAVGWSAGGADGPEAMKSAGEIFGSPRGVLFGLALDGLAVSGGLFVVPVLAAVESWAGRDRRARVMAAVNVLTAAAMAGAGLLTSLLQALGATSPALFVALGVAGLAAALAVRRTLPADE